MSIQLDQLLYDSTTNEGAKVGAHVIDGDGHKLNINADGSINSVTTGQVEISNDSGNPIPVSGTVALDSASLAALENISVTVSSEVEIKNDSGNPVPVNGTVALDAPTLAALEAITVQNKLTVNETNNAMKNSAVAISTTAAQLTATPLANRKSLLIQNLGSKEIFLGDSAVTSSNGIKIAAGANAEFKFDASVQLYAITSSGSADVRILELANN